jgi:PAS domain S-box-containing protein
MDALQDGMTGGTLGGLLAGVLLVAVPWGVAWWIRRYRRLRDLPARIARAQASRRNERIVEASGEGILELDGEGIVRFANPAAAALLGRTDGDLIGINYRDLVEAPEGESTGRLTRFTTDLRRGVGALLKLKDGRRRPVEYRVVPLIEDDRPVGTVLAFSDISERVKLDAMLAETQIMAHIGGWELVFESRRLTWTDEMFRIHDLGLGHMPTVDEAVDFFVPEDRQALRAATRAAQETGQGFDLELRLVTTRGRNRWVRVMGKVMHSRNLPARLYGTLQDITDKKLVEQELRVTRDFYQRTLNALPIGVAYFDENERLAFCNQAQADWLGRRIDEVVGKSFREIVGDDAYAEVVPHVTGALKGESRSYSRTAIMDGRVRDIHVQYIPERMSTGEVRGYFALVNDLTERKRLEEHLLAAQKMQAVGQLTGGIAHDFNNLLGIIIGNLQLLERSLAHDPSHARKVRTATRAAMRGADLTRRLLAFARRQILDPLVIDVGHLLQGLGDLLQRTLGESIDIRIAVAPELWNVRVDPGQLENALINLAINARDAMPEGGRLEVAAQNTVIDSAFCSEHPAMRPGDYVSIGVSDCGSGIPADMLPRVFEPFFTTKEHGKGSGLGLPMVYGFAEQSGGTALISSTVDRGTTVTLLLPRSVAENAPAHDDTIVQQTLPGGHETILVVEDDPDLRETVVTALRQLGYQTLEAASGPDALAQLAGDARVDLLFTDIMMPGGILGPALAQKAREARPGLSVLFTTGYAEKGVLASGDGVAASDVIAKPYRNEELAQRIRQVIDREMRVV